MEGRTFILLEQIIEKNIDKLFLNYHVLCAHPYRVMRNADLPIDEDEAADLLKEIQKQLKKRQWGEVIRLEVEASVDKKLLRFLKDELKVAEEDIFQISGPIDLTFLMKMYGLSGCDSLRYEPYKPQRVPEIEPGRISLRQSGSATFCCIIRMRRLILWSILSGRRRRIRTFLPSSRRSTVSSGQFTDYRISRAGGGERKTGVGARGAESTV